MEREEILKKKKIHFILPMGGAKGAYQAGFIYNLIKKYKNFFEIYQVDGTSIGAINGLSLYCDNIEILKEIWYSIKTVDDIFPTIAPQISQINIQVPMLNNIISWGMCYSKKAICDNVKLKNIIDYGFKFIDKNKMNNYNCVVIDLNEGRYKYINGLESDIKEYVTASASPWIIASPVKIKEKYYCDGGLLCGYPIHKIKDSEADIKLMIGYDSLHENIEKNIGSNFLSYMQTIIEISTFKEQQKTINRIKKMENDKEIEVYKIPNAEGLAKYNMLELCNAEIIDELFENGMNDSEIFAKKNFNLENYPEKIIHTESEKVEEKVEEKKKRFYTKNDGYEKLHCRKNTRIT